MKVVIINHSDSKGGASVVSLRLMRALRDCGINACMLVAHKATDDPNVHLAGHKLLKKAAFLAEHLDIYLNNGLSRQLLFQASTGRFGLPLASHPLVKNADVVILGWVNQSFLSLKEIERIKAPVIWNMHDMWCLTGICHHAGTCNRYEGICGNCRLLCEPSKDGARTDLSTKVQKSKQKIYDSNKIIFTPVSNWLADKCRKSSLLKQADIRVVPNAFPTDSFYCKPTASRAHLGLPEHDKLIVMGAARLDDPVKGIETAICALNSLKYTHNVAAVFFGDIRNLEILEKITIPYKHLGIVSDTNTLREIYAHSAVVLSSSHYETLPGTLIEGMAAGCVPVSFGQGGQADIIDHLRTGYIASYPSADDLAKGISWALSAGIDREMLHNEIQRKFSAESVAKKYISIFKDLTQ